jgi:hypothetical protein
MGSRYKTAVLIAIFLVAVSFPGIFLLSSRTGTAKAQDYVTDYGDYSDYWQTNDQPPDSIQDYAGTPGKLAMNAACQIDEECESNNCDFYLGEKVCLPQKNNKLPTGSACDDNSQCETGFCQYTECEDTGCMEGVCAQEKLPIGAICNYDYDCATNVCDFSFGEGVCFPNEMQDKQPEAADKMSVDGTGPSILVSGPLMSPRFSEKCESYMSNRRRCVYDDSVASNNFVSAICTPNGDWRPTNNEHTDYDSCRDMCFESSSSGSQCYEPLNRLQFDSESGLVYAGIDNYPAGHVSETAFIDEDGNEIKTCNADSCSLGAGDIPGSEAKFYFAAGAVLDDGTILIVPGPGESADYVAATLEYGKITSIRLENDASVQIQDEQEPGHGPYAGEGGGTTTTTGPNKWAGEKAKDQAKRVLQQIPSYGISNKPAEAKISSGEWYCTTAGISLISGLFNLCPSQTQQVDNTGSSATGPGNTEEKLCPTKARCNLCKSCRTGCINLHLGEAGSALDDCLTGCHSNDKCGKNGECVPDITGKCN